MGSEPAMKDLCFCTLALGLKYNALARQLAADLARFAPGTPFIVLSDRPFYFCNSSNVSAFRHRRKSVLGYNDKLSVIHKALQMHRTCVFLDADARIFDNVVLEDEIFEPGLRAYRIRSWTYLRNQALNDIWNAAFRDDLRIMPLFRDEFELNENDDAIPFVVEFLFSITKGDGIEKFLKLWQDLANFCECRGMFRHLGFSIGFAALLTGFPLSRHDFKGLNFFELFIPLSEHKMLGRGLTEGGYNALRSSIEIPKFTEGSCTNVFSRISRNIRREFEIYVRYAGIRIFGLKLLS